jgi:protein TonB
MAMAVLLLLAALAIVILKDHSTWFEASDGDLVADAALTESPAATNPSTGAALAAPAHVASPSKPKVRRVEPVVAQPADQPAIVATNRRALPPLDIEVVAGDSHRTVHPSGKSLRIEMAPDDSSSAPAASVTPAAQKVTMSANTTQAIEHSVDPSYPMLARQMKVQGAVVLQALIGSDGLIQDLKVVSGPGILASAAREAVRQWHFKPYLENGKAVDTQAQITVNFTISTL